MEKVTLKDDELLVCDARKRNDDQIVAEKIWMGLLVVQDGLLRFVNQYVSDALGYGNPDALAGRPLADLVHPDDARLFLLDRAIENTTDIVNAPQVRFLTKNGKTIWMFAGRAPTLYQDNPAHAVFVVNATSIRNMADSLEHYKTILNNADLHISEIDLQGRMTFINDAGCRMWGVPREELMGDGYKSQFNPGKFAEAENLFRKIYKTGKPVQNYEYHYSRRDGGQRVVEDSISLVRNPDGEVSGFVMAVQDITDRKEAEKKLNEQRARLEAIFGAVQDGIIMFDPELRVIESNKSAEKICKAALLEMTGRKFAGGGSHCSLACHEILGQTLKKKIAFREHRIECDRRNCPHQVVSISSSPLLNAQGEFLGAVLAIRDITLLRDLERELRERNRFQNLIGRNKIMQDIYALLEDLASLETTVLVTGESGTGKELVARALHYSGNRAFKPFITVNCSALTESLLESELFGHVKGAFTGAFKDKLGRFAAANGGTILLDEIGDVSPLIQLKLLRVLQEKEFERVGESIPQKVDVRVIACTNRDLKEKVKRGEFRQDLYYRLKVVEVNIPPLRKRLEDIPLLVDHFRQTFNEKFHKNIEDISREVLNAFMGYSWPGNVRELEHVMEHAFVLCHGGTISMQHLPMDITSRQRAAYVDRGTRPGKRALSDYDIDDALTRTDWNKAKAARVLGISRPTLYRRIEDYQLRKGRQTDLQSIKSD